MTERQPCQNCVAANVKCETRESRRGKHPRPSKKRYSVDSAASASRSQNAEEVAGAHVLASLHTRGIDINRPETAIHGFVAEEDEATSPENQTRQEEDGEAFLGEATSLRYVHDDQDLPAQTVRSPPNAVRLRYSVPSALRAESLIPPWEAERRIRWQDFLRKEGVFSFPPQIVVEGLLKAYFRWFHPCLAIVDEMDIWDQYHRGVLSPLLLQSMLFVGVLHCEDSVLQALGEGPRHQAKYVFYTHAKDIYDAEIEQKKITVMQALFLLSFWRAGALLEKDVRHWLGSAISLAQTKGLHRSAGSADSQAAKLRKRLWWSLYTRDRQCAAALGLPNRVRDEDCDFEFLEVSDFENAFNPSIPEKDRDEFAAYQIGMTELAKLLGQIVHTGYLPNTTLDGVYREQIRIRLNDWKKRLPPSMQPDSNLGEPPSFYANMQHLAYNNLQILLYRQGYIGTADENKDADASIALAAASRSTRIIEDMLSDNTLRHGQIHVITNLFNTLCMHTVQLRRTEGPTRTVAVSRARLCLSGLQELQKTWEVTNWILQLFLQYLDRSTAASLRIPPQEDGASSAVLPPAQSTGWSAPASPNTKPLASPNRPHAPHSIYDAATQQALLQPQHHNNTMAAPPSLPGQVISPWSWTSDEANQFLFSRIENDFSFGEGDMPDWNPEELEFNAPFFPPGDGDGGSSSTFMP